jgi:hypothetical protein
LMMKLKLRTESLGYFADARYDTMMIVRWMT